MFELKRNTYILFLCQVYPMKKKKKKQYYLYCNISARCTWIEMDFVLERLGVHNTHFLPFKRFNSCSVRVHSYIYIFIFLNQITYF